MSIGKNGVCPTCGKKGVVSNLQRKRCIYCDYELIAEYDGKGYDKGTPHRNGKMEIECLKQSLALECTQCINSFSGMPMLRGKGNDLQCRLRKCNRKRHLNNLKELDRLEKYVR